MFDDGLGSSNTHPVTRERERMKKENGSYPRFRWLGRVHDMLGAKRGCHTKTRPERRRWHRSEKQSGRPDARWRRFNGLRDSRHPSIEPEKMPPLLLPSSRLHLEIQRDGIKNLDPIRRTLHIHPLRRPLSFRKPIEGPLSPRPPYFIEYLCRLTRFSIESTQSSSFIAANLVWWPRKRSPIAHEFEMTSLLGEHLPD